MVGRVTSLYRSMAPWRPATAWALFASSIIFVSAAMSHGLESGARGGVAALLAWMITRELAPKRLMPSLLAPFAAIAWAIPAETDLLACVTVLLAARIAARTVGAPPTLLDCVGLVALAGWAATRPAGLPAALVLAAILFTCAGGLRRTRVAGVLALVVVLFVGSVEGTLTLRPEWDDANLAVQVLYAFAVAAALLLLVRPLPAVLAVRDDRGVRNLHGVDIRAARLAVVAAVLAAALWQGSTGVFALSSAAAALVAAGIGGSGQQTARRPSGTLSP